MLNGVLDERLQDNAAHRNSACSILDLAINLHLLRNRAFRCLDLQEKQYERVGDDQTKRFRLRRFGSAMKTFPFSRSILSI